MYAMSAPCHHRADALAREELEQQRVGLAAIEDVGLGHALPHRLDAGPHLRDHAAADRAIGQQLLETLDVDAADEARWVVDVAAEPLDVGEVHELLRAHGLG